VGLAQNFRVNARFKDRSERQHILLKTWRSYERVHGYKNLLQKAGGILVLDESKQCFIYMH
jgi:hypothetical protein